jgi:hypothetical protein
MTPGRRLQSEPGGHVWPVLVQLSAEELQAMVVSEGMELVIVLLVILANLVGLVLLQKWSGLT